MDSKIKEAIFRQVEKEPFAKKFNLKLIDLDEGYSKVARVFTPEAELIEKLSVLKERIKELEQSESERKRASEALRESEERYWALVENASDIVFKTDNTGHITFVNPVAIRILGYGKEEIIGRHCPTLIHPDMREEAIKFFGLQFVKGIQNTYSEYLVVTKEGREIWFGANSTLIVQDGNVAGFQVVARDITERKRMEKELEESEKNTGSSVLSMISPSSTIPGIFIISSKWRSIGRTATDSL